VVQLASLFAFASVAQAASFAPSPGQHAASVAHAPVGEPLPLPASSPAPAEDDHKASEVAARNPKIGRIDMLHRRTSSGCLHDETASRHGIVAVLVSIDVSVEVLAEATRTLRRSPIVDPPHW
jgi:hypothetical protein